MTNPTPHGQVPEALIDLIDAYADRCGSIYNAKTEAARFKLYAQALTFLSTDASPKDQAPDELGCADTASYLIIGALGPVIKHTVFEVPSVRAVQLQRPLKRPDLAVLEHCLPGG